MKRSYYSIFFIGALTVILVISLATIWMTMGAYKATDKSISKVSNLYLKEMAGRKSQVISTTIKSYYAHLDNAMKVLATEDVSSQDQLRAFLGKIEDLYGFQRLAVVDEENIVYTRYSTYTGGSRYDFLGEDSMTSPVVSISNLYGASKIIFLAIPFADYDFMGKNLKACFVELSIDDIVDSLAFYTDNADTHLCLYYHDGENLTQLDFGPLTEKQNLIQVMKEVLPLEKWKELAQDFEVGREGGIEFTYQGNEEILYYDPVPEARAMMTVLIHKDLIRQQVQGIGEETLMRSRIQIFITFFAMLSYFGVLFSTYRKAAHGIIEQERRQSQESKGLAAKTAAELNAVKKLANRDALTGVGNKYAFFTKVKEINALIQDKSLERLAVVACDLNGLKYINDTYGHVIGDSYIKDAGRLLSDLFKVESIYRTGGDEFLVILQDENYVGRHGMLHQLNLISEQNLKNGGVVISAALSDYSPEDQELHDIVQRADKAMYKRKQTLKEMGAKVRE